MNREEAAPRPTVAVIGASHQPHKFSFKSVLAHLRHGYEVFPINLDTRPIAGLQTYASLNELPRETVDRITVYVPPEIGITLLDQMASKHPGEVWFNPGSESAALLTRAAELNLPFVVACSLVDLANSALPRIEE